MVVDDLLGESLDIVGTALAQGQLGRLELELAGRGGLGDEVLGCRYRFLGVWRRGQREESGAGGQGTNQSSTLHGGSPDREVL
ncbi:hypothetical protein D3C80_2074750 [compost metagenome]